MSFYRVDDNGHCIVPSGETKIWPECFWQDEDLKSIEIPDGVKMIGEHAFLGCHGLTSVTIPDSVVEIESGAFVDCAGLTSIKIPCGVTEIKDETFYGCTGLTSIKIPSGVTKIESSAFHGCTGLTNIEIPNSVTKIGDGAFYGCTGLTNIEIPNSVTEIGGYAFEGCSNLSSVTIPDSITQIGKDAFMNCKSLTSVKIPECVTTIESQAFYGCVGLRSFEIPNNVTKISDYTFAGCTHLTSIVIPDSIAHIGEGAFKNCKSLVIVKIPKCVSAIGRQAFEGCVGLRSFEIPNNVTEIPDDAFAGCTSLTSIRIPDGVRTIEEKAFAGCSNLKSVYIPNSVTVIGDRAFLDCGKLTSIEIPSSVNYLGILAIDYEYVKDIIIHTEYNTPEIIAELIRWLHPSSVTLYVPIGSEQAFRNYSFHGSKLKNVVTEPVPADEYVCAGMSEDELRHKCTITLNSDKTFAVSGKVIAITPFEISVELGNGVKGVFKKWYKSQKQYLSCDDMVIALIEQYEHEGILVLSDIRKGNLEDKTAQEVMRLYKCYSKINHLGNNCYAAVKYVIKPVDIDQLIQKIAREENCNIKSAKTLAEIRTRKPTYSFVTEVLDDSFNVLWTTTDDLAPFGDKLFLTKGKNHIKTSSKESSSSSNLYGLVNIAGHTILPIKFSSISKDGNVLNLEFNSGLSCSINNIDKEIKLPVFVDRYFIDDKDIYSYTPLYDFDGYYKLMDADRKCTIIDSKGRFVLFCHSAITDRNEVMFFKTLYKRNDYIVLDWYNNWDYVFHPKTGELVRISESVCTDIPETTLIITKKSYSSQHKYSIGKKKFGVVDVMNGKVVIENTCEKPPIYNRRTEELIVSTNEGFGILDKEGKVIVPCGSVDIDEYMKSSEKDLFIYEEKEKRHFNSVGYWSYTRKELDDMYRDAMGGDLSNEWNID